MQIVNQVVKSDQPVYSEMQIMITQVLLKVATNTHNIKFGKEFLNMTPKAQVTKVKTDKLDMKRKNFWASNQQSEKVYRMRGNICKLCIR